ncbi:FAD-dependent oxidoreductase [Aminipila butyrica]|uniref:FAD-dependent oxidoreductase n=1 Tax=Aminipila butyrica TaxID=433296 RepID=A0A858BRY4_9FIRM|nr:FAD-dependent oxidoreductase [Aminipila butyrica]QIB68711.1 FAD-dependent oxidoreductase [Aminipila butyrica]
MMNSKYPNMFSPLKIKKTTFKNRVLAAPVTTNRVTMNNGTPTPEGIDVFETRARGGFAQITLTESFVDFEFAARHDHGINLVDPNRTVHHMESVAILTEAIKAHGALASIQFNHVGNVNHPDTCINHQNPIGPSAFLRHDGVQIDEMNEAMMKRVADNYANACGNAKALGFDMVMLHAGHGWLLSQFLSPLSNFRTDQYGGSLENRARFPIMVLDRVREEVGPDFLIELRISGDERLEGGMHLPETIEFCKLIEDRVDLIHVTSGIYHAHVETKAFSSMFDEHGCNLDLAEAIKKAVKIPVVAVGGFNSPEQIEKAIAEGKCDFVAVGRQQFADPEFVNKTLEGREDEIAPCLRCSCFNPLPPDPNARVVALPWHCAVNPWSGRELRWRQAPQPKKSRKVFVVGGGVGGLYAALTAAERGHQVILAEKKDRLGGILWFTDTDYHKESLMRYRESLIVRAKKAGVQILLRTRVTSEFLKEQKPDVVICAVGGEPWVPPIKGIELALPALTVYSQPERFGERIVIVGGGLIGCETGYYLAETGKKIHILEMKGDVAVDANDSHRRALLPRMKKLLDWSCGVSVVEITKQGVSYLDREGRGGFMEADQVIYAAGMKPLNQEVESLRQCDCPKFLTVGDCVVPRQIKQAVYEGFCAAMDIV